MKLSLTCHAACLFTLPVWSAEPAKSPAEIAAAYAELSPEAERYVLTDDALPKCEMAEPQLARELLVDYRLNITYYDSRYEQVTNAATPVRYGVVLEIVPAAERKLAATRRFLTLYRLSEKQRLNGQSADAALHLAAEFEVPAGESPASFYHQPIERDRLW